MSSTRHPAAADHASDFDSLLKANAKRVFSEPDAAKRMTALTELWAEDGELIEQDTVVSGYEAIAAGVGALLARLPSGILFAPQGSAAGHHGLARLRWRATASDETPVAVSGTDIAMIEDNRIHRLYVILDPST